MACTLLILHEPSSTSYKILVTFPAIIGLFGLVHAYKHIILNIMLRILNLAPYISYKLIIAHILYLSSLLIMGLSTYNGPYIIANLFLFISNELNSPLYFVARCLYNALSDLPMIYAHICLSSC